jgi:hypothetical protein
MYIQIFFVEKQFDEKLFKASIGLPIDISQIVPGAVLSKVGKLNAQSAPLTTAITGKSGRKWPFILKCQQFQPVQQSRLYKI